MVKSASTSTVGFTHDVGGGHAGPWKGADSVTGDPGHAAWLQQACSHLRGADPVLARLMDARPDFDARAWLGGLPPTDLFGALLDHLPAPQEVLTIAERWRSYRSLATSYLFSAAVGPGEAPPVALPTSPHP